MCNEKKTKEKLVDLKLPNCFLYFKAKKSNLAVRILFRHWTLEADKTHWWYVKKLGKIFNFRDFTLSFISSYKDKVPSN